MFFPGSCPLPATLARPGFLLGFRLFAILLFKELAVARSVNVVKIQALHLESLRGLQTQELASLLGDLLVVFLHLAVLLPQLLHLLLHFSVSLLVNSLFVRYLAVDPLHLPINRLN